MDGPVFRGYVKWYDEEDSPLNNEYDLRKWMLKCFSYEVVVPEDMMLDLRDIGNSVLGEWSAYGGTSDYKGHYFFKLATDAMAFKLRWL